MDKKLSVIVPVYNAEAYLAETLGRVLGQTFAERHPGELEVIAVDDASTDGSLALLREEEGRHPELRVIALAENRGPGGARNAALDAAAGEYIGMIDADDLPEPEMYEKLWDASFGAEGGDGRYDVVDCSIYSQAEQGTLAYTPAALCGALDDGKRARLIAEVGCPVTRIYRRELLERHGIRFRERVTTMEDQDFLCEVFARAGSVNAVPEALYVYRDTPDSATKRDAEVLFFEATVQSVLATHERLSRLPNYPGLRAGAEAFYLSQCALACGVVRAYEEQGIVTPALAEKMTAMLRQVIAGTTRGLAADNLILLERYGQAEAARIAGLLQ